MLSSEREGSQGPVLFLLHWLGGGAQTWREIGHGLAQRGVECVALDLPGFGGSASIGGYSVQAMADQVADTVRKVRGAHDVARPWLIAGHSMGGKVAGVIARRALNGEAGLEGLRGLVLASPSPPSPEPIPDSTRAEMIASLGEQSLPEAKQAKNAAAFIDNNTGKIALPPPVRERAIQGVLSMNRTAFNAWLEHGSNEDWSGFVGQIALPALIVAGTEEPSLGADAQARVTMPHYPQGQLVALQGAGHLAPLERPGLLVEEVTEFIAGLGLTLATPKAKPGRAFEELEHSAHTSPKTAAVMGNRLGEAQHWNATAKLFSPAEFRTLRALAQAVVPDAGFDLAARIDAHLAESKGDGWRYAILPPDQEAWHRGLFSLDYAANQAHGVPFLALYPEAQQTLLQQAAEGKLGKGLLGTLHVGEGTDAYTAAEMQRWFDDVRGEFTRLYVGDPRTMERIGYTGFADDLGFTQIQLGQLEEFER